MLLITFLCILNLIILSLIFANNVSANAENSSTVAICKQLKKGNYENIDLLFESVTSIKDVPLNLKKEPWSLYTKSNLRLVIKKCAVTWSSW